MRLAISKVQSLIVQKYQDSTPIQNYAEIVSTCQKLCLIYWDLLTVCFLAYPQLFNIYYDSTIALSRFYLERSEIPIEFGPTRI